MVEGTRKRRRRWSNALAPRPAPWPGRSAVAATPHRRRPPLTVGAATRGRPRSSTRATRCRQCSVATPPPRSAAREPPHRCGGLRDVAAVAGARRARRLGRRPLRRGPGDRGDRPDAPRCARSAIGRAALPVDARRATSAAERGTAAGYFLGGSARWRGGTATPPRRRSAVERSRLTVAVAATAADGARVSRAPRWAGPPGTLERLGRVFPNGQCRLAARRFRGGGGRLPRRRRSVRETAVYVSSIFLRTGRGNCH